MKKWETIDFSKVAEIINGYAFKSSEYVNSGVRIIRITNVQKGVIVDDQPKFYEENNNLIGYRLLENDILMSLTGNVGRVGVLKISLLPAYLNQRVAAIRVNNASVLPKYIFHFLNSNEFEKLAIANANGVAQKNLSTTWLKELQIPLPPLAEQKRIAAILDAADLHRKKTNQLITKYDDLSQSLFIDMFGDLVTNTQNFPIRSIRDSVDIIRDGPFGSNLKSEHYQDAGVRVVRLQNIGINQFVNENKSFISNEHYQKLKKHTCLQGDLLVATIGNPNIRACKFPTYLEKAVNKADCIQVRPNKEIIIPTFMTYLFNSSSMMHWIKSLLHGQTRTRISMGQIAKINIPIPPIELQSKFAAQIQEIEKQKAQAKVSLQRAEDLFQSLLQKAFKGGL
jgi:type I restriction enzyme S subunit